MEKKFEVVMEFPRIDGGIPANKEVIKDWLDANGIQDDEELRTKIAEGVIKEDELDKELEKITTTFRKDEKGTPAIEARCIKAAIKQAAGVAGLNGAVPGLKELIKEGSEIYPSLISFFSDGGNKVELKSENRVVHVEHMGRTIGAFKRTRYLENVRVKFQWHVTDRQSFAEAFVEAGLKKREKPVKISKGVTTLTEEQARLILSYGAKYTGFGANRSQGSGKGIVVEVKEIS